MDYEKKYKETFEKAREIYNDSFFNEGVSGYNLMERLFPELRESEDEKIKKALINYFDNANKSDENPLMQYGIQTDKVITWLKKQGEKPQGKSALEAVNEEKVANQICVKPSDNIKPKFMVGDWITNGLCTWKIELIRDGLYCQTQCDIECGGDIESIDKEYHLWTIADAKPGDILASELCDSIILFGGIKDNNIDFYCDYDFTEIEVPGDRFAVNNGQHYGSVEDTEDFHPATKEQRDVLMKAMKEAGYTFDFDKKELKKIEEECDGEDYGIDSLWHAHRILEKTLGKVEGYQSDDGILEHKCAITAVKKLCEQKPKWSEEDEKTWKELIEEVKDQLDSVPPPLCRDKEDEKVLKQVTRWLDWLKSLKQRIGG